MTFVITSPAQASLAVANTTDRFPVRRIFCVGQNYKDHVIEMGSDTREAPFFFTKPADAAVDCPCTLHYPTLTKNLADPTLRLMMYKTTFGVLALAST